MGLDLRALFSPQADVVGINRRNVELVYAHNARAQYRCADDKLLTKTLLAAGAVPVPETLAVCQATYEIERTLDQLDEQAQFVVKPASSSGGRGIVVVGERVAPGVWLRASGAKITRAELRYQLANILYGAFSNDTPDRAYVERRVVSHPVLRALWPAGLSDVRVLTLEGRVLMSMLRVPTRKSDGRANLHQGALGLALELETGRVFRALHHGAAVERHPDSGEPLLGLHIPAFDALLDAARRAAACIPLGYLGIDLVLDAASQPLVLEVNARPGLEIQNVNGRGLGSALRGVPDPAVVPPGSA